MADRDYSQEVLESSFAYDILAFITEEEKTNPSKIAESLETSYHSIRNYMKGLEEQNLIKESGKEGRKKFYTLNSEGLYELWRKSWSAVAEEYEKKHDTKEHETNAKKEEGIEFYDPSRIKSALKGNEDYEIQETVLNILISYLHIKDGSSLNKMVKEDFIYGYTNTLVEKESLPEFVKNMYMYLNVAFLSQEKTYRIYREVFEEMKEKEDWFT